MTTPRRKKEIEKVRNEGKQAALRGQNIQTNPYKGSNMNHYQWLAGYEENRLASDEEVKAERVAERIEKEAYKGTSANDDWDSEFSVDECIRILMEEY